MESAQLNEGALKQLDIFQLKGFRKILNLQHTFINRANTNQVVFRKANEAMIPNPQNGAVAKAALRPPKQILSFEKYLHEKQEAILGHIVRAAPSDPMRQTSLQPHAHMPVTQANRRVGRPREHVIPAT